MADARAACGAEKKSLDDALLTAARTGQTEHPQLRAVMRARLVNTQCGGAFVLPWEVDQIDEEWLAVFYGLSNLPDLKKNYNDFEKTLAEKRRNHPTYRKYLRN